jgi:tRNA C32,U32 (ribose-2'-O)-methylase TrmJ
MAGAGAGAAIAVMELVMPESRADLTSAGMDMQMFMGTRGRERTIDDWRRLFDRAGLALEEEVSLRSFVKILVVRAKQD